MKSASKRQLQVAELIKRNFSVVLQQEGGYIYGSNILTTITNVKMSPDLGIASVYLSIYNTENKQEVILELENSYARLRQSLGNRLKRQLRRIPELQFFIDDTLDEIARIDALFDKLHEENQMGSEEE